MDDLPDEKVYTEFRIGGDRRPVCVLAYTVCLKGLDFTDWKPPKLLQTVPLPCGLPLAI